jgi:hypothetical protein
VSSAMIPIAAYSDRITSWTDCHSSQANII